jgi:hypothetical protein
VKNFTLVTNPEDYTKEHPMSKDLNTLELTIDLSNTAADLVIPLDNLSLALVGGGDAPVLI